LSISFSSSRLFVYSGMVIQSTQALGRPRPGGARCPVLLGEAHTKATQRRDGAPRSGAQSESGLVNRSRDRGLLLKVRWKRVVVEMKKSHRHDSAPQRPNPLLCPSLPFDSGLHFQGLQMHAHPVPAYVCQHEAARRVAVGGARRGLSSAIVQNLIARAQRHLPLSSNCGASG
jgi:hypothetical protein